MSTAADYQGVVVRPGIRTAPRRRPVRITGKGVFQQGEELGQFEMGSTVILLFCQPVEFAVKEGDLVQMGQSLTA